MDGYDLTNKDVVINLLDVSIDWLKEHPEHDLAFGSYGPNLSQVLRSAIDMMNTNIDCEVK